MSGNTIGSLVGAGIGFLIGGPSGAKWGFVIGGMIGGYVDPVKIKGPRLTDATRQTSQEGVPIPWGYGTFPTSGNIIFAGPLVEHEHKEGGKGGPQTISYTYTRSYAIGVCEGPITGIQKIKRNGKLVYDISPTSEITAENAKFLEKCTIYLGDETQLVDPTIEAIVGVGNTGPNRGLAYIVLEDDDLTESQGAISQYEFVVQMCGTVTQNGANLESLSAFYYPLQSDYTDVKGLLGDLTPNGAYEFGGVGFRIMYPPGPAGDADNISSTGVDGATSWTIGVKAAIESIEPGVTPGLAGHYTNVILGYHTWALYVRQVGSQWFVGASVNAGGGTGDEAISPTPIAPGQVFTATMRRTPGLLELFIGGSFVASTPALGSVISGSGEFVVGGSQNVGSMGHVFGVTRALSDTEIATVSAQLGVVPDGYLPVPDAPGAYVDENGNLISDGVASSSISECGAILYEIFDDLCDRSGIDVATEVDSTQLTDFVAGFKCATESPADAFIESLTLSHFFDRGEWDKKVRGIKRGGANLFALTPDDLIGMDGPPIEQTRIQEPELLRKVNIMSIDPAADYNMTKQTWERRAGTIKAKGEATIEIPEVVATDDAAQIAEIRGKIAWSETDKFRFGYSVKFSKLTPTDPGTLTDKDGIVHRIRLADLNEERGAFTVEEAAKNRASIYTGTVRGVTNPNAPGPTSPGLIGPTLFVAMNLPQMRSQDGAGLYVGMVGLLPGWHGAQLLMSVDGGVSYQAVLTINTPTIMGPLTADCDAVGSASEPLAVHVYGGALNSATGAQVAQGINTSAVLTTTSAGPTAEVLAYETASEVTPGYYDLSALSRGMKGTPVEDHYTGDMFMDMATSYFVPIDIAYSGQTLYFKAVGLGISADSVDAVPVVYDPAEVVIDGGEIT